MEIVTATDAQTALYVLANDLADTQAYITRSVQSSSFSLPGTSETAEAATSLVTQLENELQSIQVAIQPLAPLDHLPNDILARLKELQQEVISDRALIGTTISDVDWTFGGILADSATVIQNLASQAVSGVSSAFGINWTLVAIVLGAIVVFIVYMKVS